MKKKSNGFSLFEVLVVITVIGILALVIYISYTSFMKSARTTAASSNAISAQKVADGYNADNKSFPGTTGHFLLGGNGLKIQKEINVIADADDTTLNSENGIDTVAYACLESCASNSIKGGRITYWDFESNTPKYIFLGDATSIDHFEYPPVLNSIIAGESSICGLADDTNVYCWGYGGTGQFANGSEGENYASVPTSIYKSGVLSGLTIKSISIGGDITCAIASDDNSYCWGKNNYGQSGNDSFTNSLAMPVAVKTTGDLSGKTILQVSSGEQHTCVIASDNKAYCWGNGGEGKLGNGNVYLYEEPKAVSTSGVLNGKSIQSISAGLFHTCAISTEGLGYCWGDNSRGQLGNNSTTDSNTPVAVNMTGDLSGKTLKSIYAGYGSTCALSNDNLAYCWGRGDYGQLGNGTTADSNPMPKAVTMSGALSGKTFKSISSFGYHTCAISSDNLAYCWGKGEKGQLGDAGTNNNTTPNAVNTSGALNGKSIISIAAGEEHTCVIDSTNIISCWGSNEYSALSMTSSLDYSSTPIAINRNGALDRLSIKSIDAGSNNACITASDNNTYCWGKNTHGQLGNGVSSFYTLPVLSLKSLNEPYALSVNDHSCANDTLNIPYCWGNNDDGQLGTGNNVNALTPKKVYTDGVLNGKTIKQFAIGSYNTCVIASDNLAYCWGLNNRLGVSTGSTSVPVAVYTGGVLNGLTITDISLYNEHTCVIASNGKVYCWGYNYHGQLGDNSTSVRVEPVEVLMNGELSGKTAKKIATGISSTCMITDDDLLYCWGDNAQGQLGNGSNVDSYVPVPVNTDGVLNGKTIKDVSVGYLHTCALASNNRVYCWGNGVSGQLGDGLATSSNVPVEVYRWDVLKDKSIKSIQVGDSFSCALTTNSEISCWGDNNYGQLGDGTLEDSSIPIKTIF